MKIRVEARGELVTFWAKKKCAVSAQVKEKGHFTRASWTNKNTHFFAERQYTVFSKICQKLIWHETDLIMSLTATW